MPSRNPASSSSVRLVLAIGLTLSLALSLGRPSTALAGPWTPSLGHYYVELRDELVTTAQGFDSAGRRRGLQTLTDQGVAVPTRLYDSRTRLYGEVGIATRLAFVLDFAALQLVSMPRPGDVARSALGVGDLGLGGRLQLLDEDVVCALQAQLVIPTGASDGPQPVGTGDLRGEVVLSVGRAWDRVPFFVVVELGARLRSSGTQRALAAGMPPLDPTSSTSATAEKTIQYASELLYAAELGYTAQVSSRVRLLPRISVEGRHGLVAPPSLVVDPVAPQSVRLLRVGASLGIGIGVGPGGSGLRGLRRVDLQVGGGAFVWGEGIPAAGSAWIAFGLSR